VQGIGCDYMVCSGYKIFAPHMGFACCRREAINRLPTFREAFIPDVTPDKLEAGTYAYENVAGMDAAIAYLEAIGAGFDGARREASRAAAIAAGMTRVAEYERSLSSAMLDAIERIPGGAVHGVTDRARLDERVPTFGFSVEGVEPAAIADALAARDVGVRSGHMYSPRLMTRLGRMPAGVVRASLVHYNTLEEVARFEDVLNEIVASLRRNTAV
jgi:selenocysteine lyase/cysteine desulfurase